jgi:hypothetical protein
MVLNKGKPSRYTVSFEFVKREASVSFLRSKYASEKYHFFGSCCIVKTLLNHPLLALSQCKLVISSKKRS